VIGLNVIIKSDTNFDKKYADSWGKFHYVTPNHYFALSNTQAISYKFGLKTISVNLTNLISRITKV